MFSFFQMLKYLAIFDFASGFFCCYLNHRLGSVQGQLPLQSCELQAYLSPVIRPSKVSDACITKESCSSVQPLRQNLQTHAQRSSRHSPMVANSSPDSASLILYPAESVAALLWLHNSGPPLGCRPRLSLQLERLQPDARQPHHPLSPHCRFQDDGAQRGG